MCALFSKLLDAPTEIEAKEFKQPVFLLGLMRSGTTLLMNVLSEHPQLLKVGFELNKIWTEIGGAPCSGKCEYRDASNYKAEFANNMTAYFQTYIEESKSIKRHLARWSAKRHYGSGGIFYDWDNVYPMNKSPHLSNKVSYVHKMFPQAKFVVLVRSIEGQVASQKMHFKNYHKQGWNFHLPEDEGSCWTNIQAKPDSSLKTSRLYPGNFELLPEAWLKLNQIMFEQLKDIPESQKIILRYEDLVENQENELRKIFEFLRLEPKHQKKVNQIVSKSRKVHNTTTKGNPTEKWKKYLDDDELSFLADFKAKHLKQIEDLFQNQ